MNIIFGFGFFFHAAYMNTPSLFGVPFEFRIKFCGFVYGDILLILFCQGQLWSIAFFGIFLEMTFFGL